MAQRRCDGGNIYASLAVVHERDERLLTRVQQHMEEQFEERFKQFGAKIKA
jgi:hypothetical protein